MVGELETGTTDCDDPALGNGAAGVDEFSAYSAAAVVLDDRVSSSESGSVTAQVETQRRPAGASGIEIDGAGDDQLTVEAGTVACGAVEDIVVECTASVEAEAADVQDACGVVAWSDLAARDGCDGTLDVADAGESASVVDLHRRPGRGGTIDLERSGIDGGGAAVGIGPGEIPGAGAVLGQRARGGPDDAGDFVPVAVPSSVKPRPCP